MRRSEGGRVPPLRGTHPTTNVEMIVPAMANKLIENAFLKKDFRSRLYPASKMMGGSRTRVKRSGLNLWVYV